MEIRHATVTDIDDIVELQEAFNILNLSEADKTDGFLNTVLNTQLLHAVIETENAVFVAELNNKIVAMAVCASWGFWSFSETLSKIADGLTNVHYRNRPLSKTNTYFWGPVCVGKESQGQGVFKALFDYSCREMRNEYPMVYTYIHADNSRSYAAHTKKTGFEFIKDFEINGQVFKELVRET